MAGKLSLCGCAVLYLATMASAVQGQPLLRLGLAPREAGVPSAASAVIEPVPAPPIDVEVDIELLRSAPLRLELPTPDGALLVAERSRFEDRGNGDAMWTGRFPGTEYESVVLTIADSGFTGYFGEPLGVKYRIGAAADGEGAMFDLRRLAGRAQSGWCDVAAADDRLDEHLAEFWPAERPYRDQRNRLEAVSVGQTDDELKILVLYTSTVAQIWNDPASPWYAGSTQAALRNAADYLGMVFRNGQLPIEPTVVFEKAPAWMDTVESEGVSERESDLIWRFSNSGEVEWLRRRHGADQVHLFYEHQFLFLNSRSGVAALSGNWAASRWGDPSVFAHEIGHNLGGHHQPEVGGAPSRAETREGVSRGDLPAWAEYAFAHAGREDGTPVEDNGFGYYGTAVSYAESREPYYSTARIRPGGRQIGIAGERENELAFKETVPWRAGQSGRDSGRPLPPANVRVETVSGDRSSVRIAWKNNSDDKSAVHVSVRAINPHSTHSGFEGFDWTEHDDDYVIVRNLPPGRYSVYVSALRSDLAASSVDSSSFVIPGAEPAPPTIVSVTNVPPPTYRPCHLENPGADRLVVVEWNENFKLEEWPPECTPSDLPGDLPAYCPASEFQILRRGALYQRYFYPSQSPPQPSVPSVDPESVSFCVPDDLYSVRVYSHSSGGRSAASEPATAGRPGPCEEGKETMCLQGGGYEVKAEWWTAGAAPASALVVPVGTDDSGLFRFFDPENWEILIKVLDGCAVNGRIWVFGASATDLGYSIRVRETATGVLREYRNEPGQPSAAITDTGAFPASCGRGASAATVPDVESEAQPPAPLGDAALLALESSGPGCARTARSLCLADERFKVTVDWSDKDGGDGPASTVPVGTGDSGLFWFFDSGNWEMLIKVLNGCAVNGHFWVYAASATDLGLDITVTDTVTGAVWDYRKEPGNPARAITENRAFPESCHAL